jgi:hypothetical protein
MKREVTINRYAAATAIAVCLALAACGSKELSRSKAAKLIKEKYHTQQMIESGAQTTQVAEMKDEVLGQSGSVFGIRGGTWTVTVVNPSGSSSTAFSFSVN